MSTDTSQLLTTQEAAKIAGVTDSRIRQLLIEDKDLHGEKFGRQWMIRRSELECWMRERQEGR